MKRRDAVFSLMGILASQSTATFSQYGPDVEFDVDSQRFLQLIWIGKNNAAVEQLCVRENVDGTAFWLYHHTERIVHGETQLIADKFDSFAEQLILHEFEIGKSPRTTPPSVFISNPRNGFKIESISSSAVDRGFMSKLSEYLFSDETGQVELRKQLMKSKELAKMTGLYTLISEQTGGESVPRPPR